MSRIDPRRLTVEDWEIWISVCGRAGNSDLGYSSIGADRRDFAVMLTCTQFSDMGLVMPGIWTPARRIRVMNDEYVDFSPVTHGWDANGSPV